LRPYSGEKFLRRSESFAACVFRMTETIDSGAINAGEPVGAHLFYAEFLQALVWIL
jgi:hypothetical protein